MKATRAEMKAEAIRRMKKLHYFNLSIKDFEKNDKVMVNEPPVGAHFYTYYYDEVTEQIEKLEEKNGCLVYAVIRGYYKINGEGEVLKMDDLLYVESEKEEWEYFDDDLDNYGAVLVYTVNYDWPECSEFGSIGIALTPAAGLRRAS